MAELTKNLHFLKNGTEQTAKIYTTASEAGNNYITVKGFGETRTLRSLTDREALRLMGYSDNFKIVVSHAQVFKQAGNSIVVDVIMSILKEIIKQWIRRYKRK